MKKKLVLLIIVFIFSMIIFVNKSFAAGKDLRFIIENYDIDMVVNEYNTFEVTETIDCNFIDNNIHGIIKKWPNRAYDTRLDGSTIKGKSIISNIQSNNAFKINNSANSLIMEIGDSNITVFGKKRYVIKYKYDVGNDQLKNFDELYYNLVNNNFKCDIKNVTFKIKMPKEFDVSKINFFVSDSVENTHTNVTYIVNNNIIKGSYSAKLLPGQKLAIKMILSDGYFMKSDEKINIFSILGFIISIICVILTFCLWYKKGNKNLVFEKLEYYPPNGLNCLELKKIYSGYSTRLDVVTLVFVLANKGYLKIEEIEEVDARFKSLKTSDYKLIKVKDYDGENQYEKIFFDDLFAESDIVRNGDLIRKFYITLDKVKNELNKVENNDVILEKKFKIRSKYVLCMIVLVFICIVLPVIMLLPVIKMQHILSLFMPLIFIICALKFIHNKKVSISVVIQILLALAIMIIKEQYIDEISFFIFVFEMICFTIISILYSTINKRTEYGNEMLFRIRCFRKFLKTAEKNKIEELIQKDSNYFYKILPYAFILRISGRWMKKFENIKLDKPAWYISNNTFENKRFFEFLKVTNWLLSNSMNSMNYVDSSDSYDGGSSDSGDGGAW